MYFSKVSLPSHEVEKSSAASAESRERLRWISQRGGGGRLFNRSLEMLKPKKKVKNFFPAGIKDFDKYVVMAEEPPEDSTVELGEEDRLWFFKKQGR